MHACRLAMAGFVGWTIEKKTVTSCVDAANFRCSLEKSKGSECASTSRRKVANERFVQGKTRAIQTWS